MGQRSLLASALHRAHRRLCFSAPRRTRRRGLADPGTCVLSFEELDSACVALIAVVANLLLATSSAVGGRLVSSTALVVLLSAYVVGGIPRSERLSEGRLFEGLSATVTTTASSAAGFVLGIVWVRRYILLSGLHAASLPIAALFIALGAFLIIESLIRIDLALRSQWALPSLPVWCVVRLAERLARTWRSG